MIKCKVCGKPLTGKQKMFCSKECRDKYYKEEREKQKPQKFCQICGKPLASHQKKVCSAECLKKWNSQYNSRYIAERRERDAEFAKKTNEWSAKSTKKGYAKRTWNAWLDHAGAILKLAEMEDAQVLIAKYLDENFQGRGERQHREYMSDEEKQASETLQSLGDIASI